MWRLTLETGRGGCLKSDPAKVIGRVVVDRALRFDEGARDAIGGALARVAEVAPARSVSRVGDFRCSSCGAVVCEGVRVKLFSGIVLKCTGCGHPNRIPR